MQSYGFFSRPFNENFNFLNNCPYDFYEVLLSYSTPKGAPACAMVSKSYDWDVRNIAKISPKMTKNSDFWTFFNFSKTVYTIGRKFSPVILHHIRVLCVQFHHKRMTGIRASQKEEDLNRLLYCTCGSCLFRIL